MIDSPSYTLNHEEVAKALEEGIVFAEGLTPTRIEVDRFGHASAVTFQDGIQLPARSVLIAAGTQPNTVLAREEGVSLELDGKYFLASDENRRAGEARAPHLQAAAPRSAAAPLPRRALHELLRRPASVVLRQRGEGDGQRQAGLPRGQRGPRAERPLLRPGRCGLPRQPESRPARGGARGPAPDADHRRSRAARAGRRAPLRARPVLPHAELRGARAARCRAPRSRWKASRSPAPGSIARKA